MGMVLSCAQEHLYVLPLTMQNQYHEFSTSVMIQSQT